MYRWDMEQVMQKTKDNSDPLDTQHKPYHWSTHQPDGHNIQECTGNNIFRSNFDTEKKNKIRPSSKIANI